MKPQCVVARTSTLRVRNPKWYHITDSAATVQYERTSGEVEIVTIDDGTGELYVTVGSDITERELETSNLAGQRNIRWSKQVAPNVVAPTVWRWQDVAPHWDEITIHSTIVDGDRTVEYQRAGVAEFWTPAEMRASIDGRVTPVAGAKILFSGTVVSLDGEPIARSRKMLLQVMSEERASGFATEDAGNGLRKITDIGRDPWQVKKLQGTVKFKSGSELKIQPLDFHGYPKGDPIRGAEFKLAPETVYYLVTRMP